mmetsp:Transcript_22059/g.77318  ORF Transcript_22059/g.77318 Transcript_22059/m.77318 type:complete len:312 (-) Transcript_22059:2419-3354(-)
MTCHHESGATGLSLPPSTPTSASSSRPCAASRRERCFLSRGAANSSIASASMPEPWRANQTCCQLAPPSTSCQDAASLPSLATQLTLSHTGANTARISGGAPKAMTVTAATNRKANRKMKKLSAPEVSRDMKAMMTPMAAGRDARDDAARSSTGDAKRRAVNPATATTTHSEISEARRAPPAPLPQHAPYKRTECGSCASARSKRPAARRPTDATPARSMLEHSMTTMAAGTSSSSVHSAKSSEYGFATIASASAQSATGTSTPTRTVCMRRSATSAPSQQQQQQQPRARSREWERICCRILGSGLRHATT